MSENLDQDVDNCLPLSFFQRDDVVQIAQDLLGMAIYTRMGDDPVTGGIITETEAYRGPEDRACHAYNNRRTKRTEVMFHQGGIAYVYLCYGMHNLFNIVTGLKDVPHAVLIRAIRPTTGIETMRARRGNKMPMASGPGTVCQALGINREHNGQSIIESPIWIAKTAIRPKISSSPRIGVDYAGPDAALPWRFQMI